MPPDSNDGSGNELAWLDERAEALRGKLNANEMSDDVERELLDLYGTVLEHANAQGDDPPKLTPVPKPAPPGASILEAAKLGKFIFRNVELPGSAFYDTWRKIADPEYQGVSGAVDHLRVVGECWGMSKLTHPKSGGRGGGLLVTDTGAAIDAGRVGWTNGVGSDVRCGLGTTFADVFKFLEGSGFCLLNQPGFSGLSVAGVIGTGGHGSGLRYGPLSSLVKRMRLGAPDGKGGFADLDRSKGDDAFDLAATHLGRLGPVHSLDLRVEPAFRISETREIRHVAAGGFGALLDEAIQDQKKQDVHSVEMWVTPYVNKRNVYTVAYGKRRITQDPPTGSRPKVLRWKILQSLGRLGVRLATALHKPWIIPLTHMAIERTETTPAVVMEASVGLDFGATNENPVTSIEMAVPLTDGEAAVDLLLKELQRLASQHDLYVYAPIGLRFVGKGANSGLSPQAGRAATLHLEVPTFRWREQEATDVLTAVQRKMAVSPFHARPHWGQRVELAPPELAALWDPKFRNDLRTLIQDLDPAGIYGNPLIDDMLLL